MKSYSIVLVLVFIIQSCRPNIKTEKNELINDFEIKSFSSMEFTDSITRQFVKDFIYLPENIHRKVFTIFFDQRLDTLNLTIFRYLHKYVDLNNGFGYFRFDGRIILLYSPFSDLISIKKDQNFEKEVNELYLDELEYYKNNRHELVMWQLKCSFYHKNFTINKNYNSIVTIYKPVIPDSVKIDIQWPVE